MLGSDGNDRSLRSRHCNKHVFVSLLRTDYNTNTVLRDIEGQMFKWTAVSSKERVFRFPDSSESSLCMLQSV